MSDRKPVYDAMGFPIEPGDVLRTLHFRGWCRVGGRRTYFLYHLVVERDGQLSGVTIPEIVSKGMDKAHEWRLWASRDAEGFLADTHIVQGFGPKPSGDFTDRDRKWRKASE